MRTFVTGDTHGAYRALTQVLERSNFNKEEDILIQLGDIVDGWSEVYECVEELLTIKNLISIRGNHDDWFRSFLLNNEHPVLWKQGGLGTLTSYCKYSNKNIKSNGLNFETDLLNTDISINHINFFKNQKPFYIDSNNNLFVHGGFNRHFDINDQIYNGEDILMWDRDLWLSAMSYGTISENIGRYKFKMYNKFKEVFIGHTSTTNWNKVTNVDAYSKESNEYIGTKELIQSNDLPMNRANIWNLDTGAGFNGKLTIMDVNTKNYWQSDSVQSLYPNEKGRN